MGFPIFSILNYALYKNFSASIISNSEKSENNDKKVYIACFRQ